MDPPREIMVTMVSSYINESGKSAIKLVFIPR